MRMERSPATEARCSFGSSEKRPLSALFRRLKAPSQKPEKKRRAPSQKIAVGDWVLVHVGFAIQKLDPDYALESLRLFEELLEENAP